MLPVDLSMTDYRKGLNGWVRAPARPQLTLLARDGYARCMRRWSAVFAFLAVTLLQWAVPLEAAERSPSVPAEDYALYDQIVTKKFLTSHTRLVVLERMTIARLIPNHEGPMTATLFEAQGYFGGELPADAVREFVAVNQEPSRLEGRFQFAVRYRFVSGDTIEEPEVRLAMPVAADRGRLTQDAAVLDRLAFSRVGRNVRNDQALAYVENMRPDGTGAGFLVWFRRMGRDWTIFDTEVVWTVRPQESEAPPLLAP